MTRPHLTLWLDGELQDTRERRATLPDRSLRDGAGAFESLRSYDTSEGPAIFRLDAHMRRFQGALDRLGHTADLDGMCAAMPRLLRANGLRDASLQPIAWLGGPERTLRQAVAALPAPERWEAGLRLTSSTYRRTCPEGDPPQKVFGGQPGRMAARSEARRQGFDDALFVEGTWVCATTTANVFFVTDGQLVAVDHPDMFPGITRDSLVRVGAAVCRRATFPELWDADEIFVTGTSAEITPVTQLDDRHLDIGPVTRALSATYRDIVRGRDRGWRHWLTLAGERRRGAA